MNIGTTIKKLRRQKDMTQESLAEYLGVSVSAVSQWELDKTSPDLSLIAPLCNLLGVTSDELLGINLEAKTKRIAEICDNAESYSARGYHSESYKILSEGLREFPDSYKIMSGIMFNTFYLMYDESLSEKERERFKEETIRLAEKISENCTHVGLSSGAIQTLCLIYPGIGKRDRAIELANKMPHMVVSRDFLRCYVYSGDEGYRADKRLIYDLIQNLSNQIKKSGRVHDSCEPYYTDDDKAALRDKQIAFLRLMFEDGDFGFYHCDLASTHSEQALYYAKHKDREKTIEHLSCAADHAIGFIKYSAEDIITHTSILLRGHESSGKSFITSNTENDALLLLNDMKSGAYDFIRDDDGFSEIEENLKPYAGEWNVMY